MSQPAPWSIKGVDKETREKMKQMAQSQGMTLADFIDNLMHANTSQSQENLADAIEKITLIALENNKNTHINLSDLDIENNELIELSQEEHEKLNPQTQNLSNAASALLKMTLTENDDMIPLEKTSIETQENIAVLNETPKATAIKKEKPKSTAPKSTAKVATKVTSKPSKHSKIDTTQSKPDLFHRLTQKIGIETPIITRLSENNITDTIVRERQLRDFMRVQLTEMRDIMGTMFEKKVDEKLHELVKMIAGATGNQAVQSFDSVLDTENLLKKEDLDSRLKAFSDSIQDTHYKMAQGIMQEFQSELENMVSAFDRQMSDIMQKTNDNRQSEHYEGRDISAGDIAAFASFQDTAEVLSSRMGRIEEVCVMLDGKLAQIQTYQNNDNKNHFNTLKDDLYQYMQSIPDYLTKAISKNDTSHEIKEVVKILHSVSKKLSFLEQSVQGFSVATQTKQATHDSYASKLSDYRNDDDDDDILETIKDINNLNKNNDTDDSLDNDWEDSEEDKPRINKPRLKQDVYDEDDDDYNNNDDDDDNDDDNDNDNDNNINEIRKFDRDAMLKGVKKSKNKDTMRKNKKASLFDLSNRKNLMIVGGFGIAILVTIFLVLL